MSTWYAVSYTRDVDTIDKIAGNMGRPRAEMRGAIQGLDPYTWMFVGRDPNAPIVVTKPPEIKKSWPHTIFVYDSVLVAAPADRGAALSVGQP